jgi:hypothetical protein
MLKISEFFFEYILFPTALVGYVVMLWGLIVWAIRTINQMGREEKEPENGQRSKTEDGDRRTEDRGRKARLAGITAERDRLLAPPNQRMEDGR